MGLLQVAKYFIAHAGTELHIRPNVKNRRSPFPFSREIEVLAHLPKINREPSELAVLRNDPEIIVTAFELWICKYGHGTLWNNVLTGGKKPGALHIEG